MKPNRVGSDALQLDGHGPLGERGKDEQWFEVVGDAPLVVALVLEASSNQHARLEVERRSRRVDLKLAAVRDLVQEAQEVGFVRCAYNTVVWNHKWITSSESKSLKNLFTR